MGVYEQTHLMWMYLHTGRLDTLLRKPLFLFPSRTLTCTTSCWSTQAALWCLPIALTASADWRQSWGFWDSTPYHSMPVCSRGKDWRTWTGRTMAVTYAVSSWFSFGLTTIYYLVIVSSVTFLAIVAALQQVATEWNHSLYSCAAKSFVWLRFTLCLVTYHTTPFYLS